MFNDPNWAFMDEPNVMWGRQLEYREVEMSDGYDHYVVTPDRRRFKNLRRAFAFYRVGLGERGPGDEQLALMRRTMNWIHCRQYEQAIVPFDGECPRVNRLAKLDDRRVICDVFGGSRPLFEHYLLHLEMLGLATPIDARVYGLTREGQAALILLELSRPDIRSGVSTSAFELGCLTRNNRWITVDSNQWASGVIMLAGEYDDDEDN